MLMGFLVTTACGWIGNYLILRRMALVGDAISHSVLPGIVIAFLWAQSRQSAPMFVGALAAAVVTTVLIESIHRNSQIKQDAAIGITFSSLFAVGVILIAVFADKIDLDQDCVLHGDLVYVASSPAVEWFNVAIAPPAIVRMAGVTIVTLVLVVLFYKELLLTSFDPGLGSSLGFRSRGVHYCLMGWLSIVVVSAFEAVGAILVIAMLILPGATASLITHRLPRRLILSVLHAALSSVLGLHLSVWLDCTPAGAMVVVGSGLFLLVWIPKLVPGLSDRDRRKLEEPARVDRTRSATEA
jgi:manganese/zinc/iron transport system permease protein